MTRSILCFILALCPLVTAQYDLEYYLSRAMAHAPALQEYANAAAGNRLQQKINRAENAASQLSLSGNFLLTPYFNNHGRLVTTEPAPEAVGYDVALFDGGLYSAQLNLERSLLNGAKLGVLDRQIAIQGDNLRYGLELEKHALRKEVIDRYLTAWQALLLARLADETTVNLEQQLRLTGGLVQQGLARTQDQLLLKVEYQTQAIARADARQEYRASLYALNTLAGLQDTVVVEIDSLILELMPPPSASRFSEKFVLDSLILGNKQEEFETRYQPALSVFLNAGLNAVTLRNISRKFGTAAGLSLNWPIYDGRQKSLTRQQTTLQQNSLRAWRRFSDRTLAMQVNESRSRIRTLQGNLLTYARQLEDFRQLLQLSSRQLEQGQVTMLEHLTLLRQYIDLRKDKISAELECQREINTCNYWNW